MTEFEKIYEQWNANQEDTPEIISLWERIESTLPLPSNDIHTLKSS